MKHYCLALAALVAILFLGSSAATATAKPTSTNTVYGTNSIQDSCDWSKWYTSSDSKISYRYCKENIWTYEFHNGYNRDVTITYSYTNKHGERATRTIDVTANASEETPFYVSGDKFPDVKIEKVE